jgi:hypothetical protein
MPADPDVDLALPHCDDDDFGFWGRQLFNDDHFQPILPENFVVGSSHVTPLPFGLTTEPADFCNAFVWRTPDKPCGNCSLGGFSCKIVEDGQYKGFCSSCIDLQCKCSFGLAPDAHGQQGITFPSKPWPTIGEHPDLPPHGSVPPASLVGASLSEASKQQPATSSSAEIGHSAHGFDKNSLPPKIGTRFSRESVKTLKDWLYSHSDHPYPDEEEKEMLQRQTGLNKTQISNWLTNARRRCRIQPPRSTSPYVRNTWTGPIDIPRRLYTPAFENNTGNLNPLERWVDSPPENEPASVTAIAHAVALNSEISLGLNSPCSFVSTDDGSNPSLYNVSSASSAGTSSGASFGSMTQQRGRRRRRRAVPKRKEKPSLAVPLKRFQCTFCTETFGTKHDWQRHEKSLHLSLERWTCAPDGPRVLNPQTNQICCIFCGEVEPSDAHIKCHNHLACLERSLEDRTFYRKDHLNQHLRLMHNVKFLDWSMKSWKVTGPDIRSRCGFCGIAMSNWSIRVDHLAEHFKTGDTMADWKGDWGFEAPVLNMVENFIPPCM